MKSKQVGRIGIAVSCLVTWCLADGTELKAMPLTFSPVVDGSIIDHMPRNGIPEFVEAGLGVFVNLNPLNESQGIIEFNIEMVRRQVASASLTLVPIGTAIQPGTTALFLRLYGDSAGGSIQLSDFNSGIFISQFNALATPLETPIVIDVTGFVRRARPTDFIGFNIRGDPLDVAHQVNFGSLELGRTATLSVTLVPEPESKLLWASALLILLFGRVASRFRGA